MEKVFIDTDVILDLLEQRKDFLEDATSLFALVEERKIAAFVSPLIIANLYYILRKKTDHARAHELLHRLRLLVRILPVTEKTIDLALTSAFSDFEDAIQYYAALEHAIDCIITRNKRDFKKSEIPVYTPSEFLQML